MESLTTSAREIAVESQHEASIVRIITFVTLAYLPSTFVSTFFSSDILRFDSPDQNKPLFSGTAFWIWVLFSALLTVVTMTVAWRYYRSGIAKVSRQKTFDASTIRESALEAAPNAYENATAGRKSYLELNKSIMKAIAESFQKCGRLFNGFGKTENLRLRTFSRPRFRHRDQYSPTSNVQISLPI